MQATSLDLCQYVQCLDSPSTQISKRFSLPDPFQLTLLVGLCICTYCNMVKPDTISKFTHTCCLQILSAVERSLTRVFLNTFNSGYKELVLLVDVKNCSGENYFVCQVHT